MLVVFGGKGHMQTGWRPLGGRMVRFPRSRRPGTPPQDGAAHGGVLRRLVRGASHPSVAPQAVARGLATAARGPITQDLCHLPNEGLAGKLGLQSTKK